MYAKRLPSVLELLEQSAGADGLQINSECRMGWCTQCSCDKSDVEKILGPVGYRSEPSIPPTSGKILTCISTQKKATEDIDGVRFLFDLRPNASVVKKNSILARLPEPHEIGGVHKTLVVVKGKVVVGQRNNVEHDSIVVRSQKELAPGKFSEMIVSAEKFTRTYGRIPSSSAFSEFKDAKPVQAYLITPDVAALWKKDGGRMYYADGKDTVEVFVGSVITVNGKAITDDMATRLELRREKELQPAPLFEKKFL